MSGLLKSCKRAAFLTLKGTGTMALLRNSAWRTARLPILCYHGIAIDDEHHWDPTLFMSTSTFERRLRFLRDGGYNVVTLSEGLLRLREGRLEPKTVVMTFDDGNHDFFTRALPALKRFGFPATVYLTTYYCDFRAPVFSVYCSYLLWKGGTHSMEVAGRMFGAQLPLDFTTPAGRGHVLAAINQRAAERGWTAEDKAEIGRELAAQLKLDATAISRAGILQLMTPAEVAECGASGIEIELHTHRHRTPNDEALFRREIRDNRQRILQITGRNPTHFCYPSGVCAPEFLPWLRGEGVESATTCKIGIATQESEALLLPRVVDTSDLNDTEFEAAVSGIAGLRPRWWPAAD